MIRLAIDCADKAVSCAVARDGVIVGHSFLQTGQTHSQTLMPQIEAAMEQAGITAADVDEFAVSCGPGSFTGLRIGIAAVKGLSFVGDKPCRAVSTLHAIAASCREHSGTVCAVMDARCSQVYNSLFCCQDGRLRRLCDDRALMIDELGDELAALDEPILLVGPGARLCYEQLSGRIVNLGVADVPTPDAACVAAVADEYGAVSAASLMPAYLRLPQAERELKAKQNNSNGGNKI